MLAVLAMLIPRSIFGVFVLAWAAGAAALPKGAALLEARCLKCHGRSTRMGGLSLASVADAKKGGAHGPAIVPGKPDEGTLLGMISGDRPKMPAGGPPLTA